MMRVRGSLPSSHAVYASNGLAAEGQTVAIQSRSAISVQPVSSPTSHPSITGVHAKRMECSVQTTRLLLPFCVQP